MKDLKKMAEDVDLMIERMDEQINNVTKAHREELEEIEVIEMFCLVVDVGVSTWGL